MFGTHFLRLQTEGAVEPLDDDLALLQGGRARLLGGAAVDAEGLQRGDRRPLLAGFSLLLPGTSHPEAPPTHGGKQSTRVRTSGRHRDSRNTDRWLQRCFLPLEVTSVLPPATPLRPVAPPSGRLLLHASPCPEQDVWCCSHCLLVVRPSNSSIPLR